MIADGLAALRAIPELEVVDGAPADAYRIGEAHARAVVLPKSHEAAAAALQACAASGLAVVPYGGGTAQALGHPPARVDVVLSLEGLHGVHAYDPRDLTLSVEAGTTLAEVTALLARARQHLPVDAPLSARSTVGGLLATGHAGWRAEAYGRPRDLLIGLHVALPDGSQSFSGGMVVKNVTGYDLGKLHAGALGTLGVILRANFKVLPLAPMRRFVWAPLPEGTLCAALARLDGLALRPSAAVVSRGWANDIPGSDGEEGRVCLMLEGAAGEIDRATRDLRSALGAAGVPSATLVDGEAADAALARLSDLFGLVDGEGSVAYRMRVDAEQLAQWAATLERTARRAHLAAAWAGDALDGGFLVRLRAASSEALRAGLASCEAAIRAQAPGARILHGPAWARADLPVWGEEPGAISRMREIKHAYDPAGVLNPGRFVGKM